MASKDPGKCDNYQSRCGWKIQTQSCAVISCNRLGLCNLLVPKLCCSLHLVRATWAWELDTAGSTANVFVARARKQCNKSITLYFAEQQISQRTFHHDDLLSSLSSQAGTLFVGFVTEWGGEQFYNWRYHVENDVVWSSNGVHVAA